MRGNEKARHNFSYYAVNAITLYRVIASIILLILILTRQLWLFKWMLALSFFTDAIDGWLARRYKVVSSFGSRMDSLGDDLTVLAGTVGLFFFKLEFLKEQWIFFVILLVLFIIQVLTAFYKFGKTTSFHTYFAKLAAILQGCFLILVFFTPEPWLPLFYAAIGITMIELIEEIILVFVVPKWETDIKGLYWVLKKKGKK